ncbi:hypothetical protein FHX34_104670 [Actinoplanes teichomyceticus]|uniref:Uncharacterized protein n=1 Tax=Actinoplanes teichomyceticus TaxID=1867 RepID=A0A561VS03_ACTTI|nr:hypothetical protein FHX34_104670 [Actinoplanes teichomyceticus]
MSRFESGGPARAVDGISGYRLSFEPAFAACLRHAVAVLSGSEVLPGLLVATSRSRLRGSRFGWWQPLVRNARHLPSCRCPEAGSKARPGRRHARRKHASPTVRMPTRQSDPARSRSAGGSIRNSSAVQPGVSGPLAIATLPFHSIHSTSGSFCHQGQRTDTCPPETSATLASANGQAISSTSPVRNRCQSRAKIYHPAQQGVDRSRTAVLRERHSSRDTHGAGRADRSGRFSRQRARTVAVEDAPEVVGQYRRLDAESTGEGVRRPGRRRSDVPRDRRHA